MNMPSFLSEARTRYRERIALMKIEIQVLERRIERINVIEGIEEIEEIL